MMDEYGVFELPAPVTATDDSCHGRCAGHGAKPPDPGGGASITPPAPALADREVAWLQRVLKDVRFSLERGY
ncbi:MAG: hypothetical protein ACRDSI_07780 [Pseudonocardiaceae bacterium]